jgi:hypothetical protein
MDKRSGKKKKIIKSPIKQPIAPEQNTPIPVPKKTHTP